MSSISSGELAVLLPRVVPHRGTVKREGHEVVAQLALELGRQGI
jgi:hypothetical protein